MSRWMPVATGIAAICFAGCLGAGNSGAFSCEQDSDCVFEGAGGTCESTGFCSFVDGACPSGSRYGEFSGPLSGICVGQEPDTDAGPNDPDADRPDADPSLPRTLHVPPGGDFAGTGDLVLSSGTIDTEALTIPGGLPSGVSFDTHAQEPAGPDLAVLHVNQLSVESGAVVRVTGSRPLVIIAGGAVTISGVLDAGGRLDTPGAGGAAPSAGPGAGAAGEHKDTFHDSGGGGGGFAATGGDGGDAGTGCGTQANGGGGGGQGGDGTVSELRGGSGGGTGSQGSCSIGVGGAGGGALQLSSYLSISIDAAGVVIAGGGGGSGGVFCGNDDAGAGGGGGSGGAVVLQAPTVANDGALTANGGGGGGGGCGPGGTGGVGKDGGATASAASGGGPGGSCGELGGDGAAGAQNATNGVSNNCDGNAGGGGGAAGRIAIFGAKQGSGLESPAAVVTP